MFFKGITKKMKDFYNKLQKYKVNQMDLELASSLIKTRIKVKKNNFINLIEVIVLVRQ
jgi:hypothetical protein